jgi:hypothetical protein
MKILRSVVLAIGLMGLAAGCGGSSKGEETTPVSGGGDACGGDACGGEGGDACGGEGDACGGEGDACGGDPCGGW